MNRCDRAGCGGELDATGRCTVCMMPPLASSEQGRAAPPPPPPGRTPPGRSTPRAAPVFVPAAPRAKAGPAEGGPRADDSEVDVPLVPPEAAVRADLQVPEEDRICSHCGNLVGEARGDQPALLAGRCPRDGTPYSFVPELARGEVLKDRYEIEGCIGHGGLGWVYAARDRHLDPRRVAIKGLIAADDPAAIEKAEAEKRFLIELRHGDIVEITDFVTQTPQSRQGRGTRGYIVMEYVPGLPLTSPRLPDLSVEQLLRYGLRILGVFRFLHERGYLFCDLKPSNVMAYGTKVKLIDLGAVRRSGEEGEGSYTADYAAPELAETGPTVATDLFTVGRTLEDLFIWHADNAGSTAYESLRLLLNRAIAEQPGQRFESAAAMAGQLTGVLGELVARRTRRTHVASSELFARAAALIDNGWGAVPKLDWWTTRSAREAARAGAGRPLDVRPPQVAAAVAALPRPHPDPADSAAGFLATSVSADPAEADRQLADYRNPTRAIHLWRCLALLQLGRFDEARAALGRATPSEPGTAGSAPAAGAGVPGADSSVPGADSSVPGAWQLAWHAGLLELAAGNPAKAETAFASCRRRLPGESAAQLALALCGEYLARTDAQFEAVAERYLTAWRMDMWQESAALGYARVRARLGKRAAALKVLAEVPDTSPHRRAVHAAALRIRVGWLGGGSSGGGGAVGAAPGPEDLTAAESELGALAPEGSADRHRFDVLVVEAALAAGHGKAGAGGPRLELLRGADGEHGIRLLLAEQYRGLARQAASADQHTVLVDLANVTRPLTAR